MSGYSHQKIRVIMLVDLDYFFAQCEELRNPGLSDKPIVVGMYSGRTEDSGAVSTANYIARNYGVKSGIPLYLAKRKLEGVDAVFLPVDYQYYEKISNQIMNLLRNYANEFEQVSIDEAYMDVTRRVNGSYEKTKPLVDEIKKMVHQKIGLKFSVGVGPNKLVAKIASEVNKPDGFTLVKPEEVEKFLAPLAVDKLLGIGKKTRAKLEAVGIKTIGDLALYDVQKLVDLFGKTLGVYFHNSAMGIDNDPVRPEGEAGSISRIGTLKQNTKDIQLILEKTDEQIGEILKEVIQNDVYFNQVGVIAVLTDLSTKSRSQKLSNPTRNKELLKRVVKELFEKFLEGAELDVRRVGVKVSQFSKMEDNQKQLTSYFGS